MRKLAIAPGPPRIREKSVFEVDDSRLAIGVFTRPLLDAEARNFRRAWESDPLPGFAEFELDRERISFVTPPENVGIAWSAIDRLLASATENVKKASQRVPLLSDPSGGRSARFDAGGHPRP